MNHKYKITGSRCVFNKLRRVTDVKHLIRFQSETVFKFLQR